MDRCGNTIEEIAAHKAGIIKPGAPVVTGATGKVFLFGALADKDYSSVVRLLFRQGDRVVVLRPDSERAAESAAIAREITAAGIEAETADQPRQAFLRALEFATPAGIVCVAGSMYMIGGVREIVQQFMDGEPR